MCPTEDVFRELQKIPWFRELKEEHLRQIAAISFLRHAKSGEIFFHEGDKQDYIYVVVEGRVALDIFIPHRGKVRFYTAEEWDVFGWSSVTPAVHQRTAAAVAVIDSTVIATDSGNYVGCARKTMISAISSCTACPMSLPADY